MILRTLTFGMKKILIVEDDTSFSIILKNWLEKKGFKVSSVGSIAHAKKNIESENYNLVLSDLRLPDEDGIVLLKWMKEKKINIPLIMMTGYADIRSAVTAIKLGANDYIAKPVNPDELLEKIKEAFSYAKTGLAAPESSVINKTNHAPYSYLEGESAAAKRLYNHVGLVAPTNMSVLIIGASGTGKEYVAHRIHELSKRKNKPFVPIDCGSIPKELAASEFFGHIKGAFTGAVSDKTGAFVAANEGTVFLDEIGNLSYEVQVQLLRALQERKIRPVGSNREIDVDIRFIAATNEKLELAIEKGNFREDLFHRINEFTLLIPDLKDREDDIMLFANLFLNQANEELCKDLTGFDEKATLIMREYHWPGNLRQMKNIIKRATLLAQGKLITVRELGDELIVLHSQANNMTLHNSQSEKNHILEALRQSGYNKTRAAQLLNIDRKTLYNKIRLYDLGL